MSRFPLPSRRMFGLVLSGLAVALFSSVGCQSSKKPLLVSGKVTKKGEPVGGGSIKLTPVAEGGAPVPGAINPDGTFSFGGVPPGEYLVSIETESVKTAPHGGGNYMNMPGMKMPEGVKGPEKPNKPDPKYVPINPKYKDPKSSGLTWNVSSSNKTKDFDLTD